MSQVELHSKTMLEINITSLYMHVYVFACKNPDEDFYNATKVSVTMGLKDEANEVFIFNKHASGYSIWAKSMYYSAI